MIRIVTGRIARLTRGEIRRSTVGSHRRARLVLAAAVLGLIGCHSISPTPTAPTSNNSPLPSVVAMIAIVPSPGSLPIGGGVVTVHVETSAGPGVVAPRVAVTLETDTGDLSRTAVETDGTGHATLQWAGTSSAMITARAGDVVGSGRIPVAVPQTFPPPSQPPPPRPPEPPAPPLPPAPQPPPELHVALSSSVATAAIGVPVTFTAAVSGASDPIAAFVWDFNGDGTADATTLAPTRAYAFSSHGVMTAKVTILTLGGRQASGTARVVVTN